MKATSTQISDLRDRLVYELKAWLGPGVGADDLTALRGGRSSECYSFQLIGAPAELPKRLVLRFVKENLHAELEQGIQNAVAQLGFPAPRVWWIGASGGGMLGRPYVIMVWVDGREPLAEGAARRVPVILAETMARLHSLDRELLHDSVLSNTLGWAPGVGNLIPVLRRSVSDGVREAVDWFDTRAIDHGPTVLCHGDLHPRNLLMRGGQVTAVLDWEIASFGPAEYDVARTELLLQLMPGVGGRLMRPVLRLLGQRLARQFLDAYRTRAKLDDQMLTRCRALHALRLVGIVRSPVLEVNESVQRLWRPFERELIQRWQSITGTTISQ